MYFKLCFKRMFYKVKFKYKNAYSFIPSWLLRKVSWEKKMNGEGTVEVEDGKMMDRKNEDGWYLKACLFWASFCIGLSTVELGE